MKLIGTLILTMTVMACSQNNSKSTAVGKLAQPESSQLPPAVKDSEVLPTSPNSSSSTNDIVTQPKVVQLAPSSNSGAIGPTASEGVKINTISNADLTEWSKTKVFSNYFDMSKTIFLSMTPDKSKLVVVDNSSNVRILDFKSRKQINIPFTFNNSSIFAVSPDGSKFAATDYRDCSRPELKMIDLYTLKEVEIPFKLNDCVARINYFAFSPDSSKLLTVDNHNTLGGFVLKKNSNWFNIPHAQDFIIDRLAFSPDGSMLIMADSFSDLKLFDLKSLKEIPSNFGRNYGGITQLKFTPDGLKIIAIGESSTRVLDLKTKQEIKSYAIGQYTRFRSFLTKDWSTLVAVRSIADFNKPTTNIISVLDLKTMKDIERPLWSDETEEISDAFMTPDGSKLFTTDTGDELRVLNLKTFEEIKLESQPHRNTKEGLITPDSTKLATFGWNGEVRMLDIQTMKEIAVPYSHPGEVELATVTPDGSKIITTDKLGNLVIWFKDPKEADLWN